MELRDDTGAQLRVKASGERSTRQGAPRYRWKLLP
jgi:hypothetical protein